MVLLPSDQDMWDAIIQCNEKYDGLFIYAVKSTGICCKPSCKSRAPLRENISFYATTTLAIEDGFRPCKRCRPDLNHSNEEEIIYSSKQYIDRAISPFNHVGSTC
ncbi:Ada metal-binding domain-containing protein [Gottfriedia sp. OAE603]|uniref:Ada metal-binding domain-containing protein n=1 Tax=Gottfriedia sp. OAE603 TaxID=2663872 RepID=UPI0034897B96